MCSLAWRGRFVNVIKDLEIGRYPGSSRWALLATTGVMKERQREL